MFQLRLHTFTLRPNFLPRFRISARRYASRPFNVRSCTELVSRQDGIGAIRPGLVPVEWNPGLRNIYVVKKPWNPSVRDAMIEFIHHIHGEYPHLNVIVGESVVEELSQEVPAWNQIAGKMDVSHKYTRNIYTGSVPEIIDKTDLIVTLGGDGTILRAVSSFANEKVPPLLSFALGNLGFLLPFDFKTYKESFRAVYDNKTFALHRKRLQCVVKRRSGHVDEPVDFPGYTPSTGHPHIMLHAMNDITLHRGGQPNLTSLDVYLNDEFFTTTTGDGISCSSPTGSTAYSLSAGGSIVHPLVPCILLTPICPRSLSFRPVIIPETYKVMMRLTDGSRNSGIMLNVDGIPQPELRPGDELHISIEPTQRSGLWCIARSKHDWTKDINELLGFNSSFRHGGVRRP
ncbi:NADH kinase POS5 mitochondrial [Meyerozyma sp. JA9]|nr:NADH kinase POS5 mitochondrial [Meyerozyma sp. JA9]